MSRQLVLPYAYASNVEYHDSRVYAGNSVVIGESNVDCNLFCRHNPMQAQRTFRNILDIFFHKELVYGMYFDMSYTQERGKYYVNKGILLDGDTKKCIARIHNNTFYYVAGVAHENRGIGNLYRRGMAQYPSVALSLDGMQRFLFKPLPELNYPTLAAMKQGLQAISRDFLQANTNIFNYVGSTT